MPKLHNVVIVKQTVTGTAFYFKTSLAFSFVWGFLGGNEDGPANSSSRLPESLDELLL